MKKTSGIVAIVLVLVAAVFVATFMMSGPSNNLVIAEAVFAGDQGISTVSGAVENRSDDEVYANVRVDVEFVNIDGTVVDRESVETSEMDPNALWAFEVRTTADGVVDFTAHVSSSGTM